MADILKEINKVFPKGTISESLYEGANIVIYTKDKEFFKNNKEIVKEAVNKFKKRIEIRPDPSLCMEIEEAKKLLKKLIPKDAGADEFIFDPPRSEVVIHADKPGVIIGKRGEGLRELREKTYWVPLVKRNPPIKSKLIEGIRSVLYENADYRKKFLNKVGHKVYDGWLRDKEHEWVRVSYLGGARQVGRSCLLLQTPKSRII